MHPGSRCPRCGSPIRWFADRGVEPREDERERLTGAELGREHPEREHDPGIRIVGAEPPPGDPRAHDVDDQERRQGQPDRVLNRLPPRHAQASPVVQEPERQHAVHRDRAVERQSAQSASAQQQGTSPKPASKATKAANLAMQRYLNFNEKEDFENAP